MRDMTPDELDDWLSQHHTMLVKEVSMGSVDVKVDCLTVTDACRHWDFCVDCGYDLDEDREDGLKEVRHGIVHRWDHEELDWKIPTDVCMMRVLPMSTFTENRVLRSRLITGDTIAVYVKAVWEDHRWCVQMDPERTTWGEL